MPKKKGRSNAVSKSIKQEKNNRPAKIKTARVIDDFAKKLKQEAKDKKSKSASNSKKDAKKSSGSSKKKTYGGNKSHASSRGGSRGSSRGGNRNSRSSGGRSGGGNTQRRGGGRKIPTFDPSRFINLNPVDVVEEVYTAKHAFSDFAVDPLIHETLERMKIVTPSPIQDQTIPASLEGNDVVGLAETGTGKTAAFLIPLIQKTLENNDHQTLILAPTRELAIQINDELRLLGRNFKLFSVTCVGGININPQIKALRRPNHFVIGTPGRVLDLIKRGKIKPKNFNAVVLDEADRMLDMGFIHDMRSILSSTPKNRQTLFFSATMSDATKNLIHEFLNKPVMVSVKKKDVTNSIEQDIIKYGHHDKFETLERLLAGSEFKRVIIFGAMKHSVEKLSKTLVSAGIDSVSIHGNKSHGQRQKALKTFKEGQARVMVATDVAARGIHVDDVSHVINYDLPQTFEDYVHRIGRTGRGKKRGKALTFVQ